VATVSKIDKITGLFCKISSLLRSLLQKRPIILSILLTVATRYMHLSYMYMCCVYCRHALADMGISYAYMSRPPYPAAADCECIYIYIHERTVNVYIYIYIYMNILNVYIYVYT